MSGICTCPSRGLPSGWDAVSMLAMRREHADFIYSHMRQLEMGSCLHCRIMAKEVLSGDAAGASHVVATARAAP